MIGDMKKILVFVVFLMLILGVGAFFVYRYFTSNQGVLAEQAIAFAKSNIEVVTDDPALQDDAMTFVSLLEEIFVRDGRERHYLILLQNNMELRPGGGFLGQYATVVVQDATVVSWEVFDANHLDREVVSDIAAPASFQQYLGISKMEFRDSNWEMDFPLNAERAEHLYNLSSRSQQFDGIFAVNASVMEDLLAITGPLRVTGYEKHGEFTSEGVLLQIQDIVEKPFILAQEREACRKRELKTGIEEVCNTDPETGEKIKKVTHADRENRKQVLPLLLQEILTALIGSSEMSLSDRFSLGKDNLPKLLSMAVQNLGDRDIQMWFREQTQQEMIAQKNWGTAVDTAWEGDYLAVVDANLGALKSDYYIKRTLEYTVDFTGKNAQVNDVSAGRMVRYRTPEIGSQVLSGLYDSDLPLATMRMSYEHTAKKANYRTSDYHAYTRLYTPKGASWKVREWFGVPDVEEDVYGNKQAYGYKFDIFIGDTLPTMLQYTLPERITEDGYALKIQKQSGVEILPTTVRVITGQGKELERTFDLLRDAIVRLEGDRLTVEYL